MTPSSSSMTSPKRATSVAITTAEMAAWEKAVNSDIISELPEGAVAQVLSWQMSQLMTSFAAGIATQMKKS